MHLEQDMRLPNIIIYVFPSFLQNVKKISFERVLVFSLLLRPFRYTRVYRECPRGLDVMQRVWCVAVRSIYIERAGLRPVNPYLSLITYKLLFFFRLSPRHVVYTLCSFMEKKCRVSLVGKGKTEKK